MRQLQTQRQCKIDDFGGPCKNRQADSPGGGESLLELSRGVPAGARVGKRAILCAEEFCNCLVLQSNHPIIEMLHAKESH